jgi:hypothetical protein
MPEVVLFRDVWMPRVLNGGGGRLLLEVVGGADALHDPRTFTVPVREEHVGALRDSVHRHVLLHGAMGPLSDAAGTEGPWDAATASGLLDPVLLGTAQEVDAALRRVRVDRRTLIAHGASIPALERRDYSAAAEPVTVATDWSRVWEHEGV